MMFVVGGYPNPPLRDDVRCCGAVVQRTQRFASIRVDLPHLRLEPVADLFDIISVWEERCQQL
jgi:hypothetical protein